MANEIMDIRTFKNLAQGENLPAVRLPEAMEMDKVELFNAMQDAVSILDFLKAEKIAKGDCSFVIKGYKIGEVVRELRDSDKKGTGEYRQKNTVHLITDKGTFYAEASTIIRRLEEFFQVFGLPNGTNDYQRCRVERQSLGGDVVYYNIFAVADVNKAK